MAKQVEAAARLVEAAAARALERAGRPVLVAIDGRSGTGKSTLARGVAVLIEAVIVPSDDFFAAEIPSSAWDRRSAEARSRDAIDWKRLRADALEPLLDRKPARWRGFDFGAPRPDGTYAPATEVTTRDPAPVILVEGAYSSRPELSDLISLSVLVEAPADVREARLRAREEAAFLREWHERWDVAEEHYFTQLRPRSSFDLVVRNP